MLSTLVHPRTGPLSRKRMIEAIAANISHVPFQSNGFFSGLVSDFGITVRARRIAAIPIGTLIRKIQCHERNAVRSPPSGGPNVKAIPPVVAITPIPSPRFPSGRNLVIKRGAAAAIMEAPRPWIPRAIIITERIGEIAERSEPAAKMKNPIEKTSRIFPLSATRPNAKINPAMISRYAITIHEPAEISMPYSAAITGIATFTMELSRLSIKIAKAEISISIF